MWWCDGLLDKTLGSVGMLTARQRGQEQRSTLNNLSSRQSSHRRIAHATLFPPPTAQRPCQTQSHLKY